MKNSLPASTNYKKLDDDLRQDNSAIFAQNDGEENALKKGNLLLHEACIRCDLEMVKVLLKHDRRGETINAVNDQGMTPLYYICAAKDFLPEERLALAKFLLEKGANPDFVNPNNKLTPLDVAKKRNPEIAELIATKKAQQEASEQVLVAPAEAKAEVTSGVKATAGASGSGAKKKKPKPTAPNAESEEGLLNAAIKAAKTARDEGEEILTPKMVEEYVVEAVKFSELEIKFYPKKGVFDINAKDAAGNTILHHLCKRLDRGLAEIVTSHPKIKLDLANGEGQTPFLLACRFGNMPLVNILAARPSVNLGWLDKEGNSALHYLATHRNEESTDVAQEIIRKVSKARGAEGVARFVNAKNKSDLTPAGLCCHQFGNSEILQMLLDRGVNKDEVVDQDRGNRLLHTACLLGNAESAIVLIKAGANLEAENKEKLVALRMTTNLVVAQKIAAAIEQLTSEGAARIAAATATQTPEVPSASPQTSAAGADALSSRASEGATL